LGLGLVMDMFELVPIEIGDVSGGLLANPHVQELLYEGVPREFFRYRAAKTMSVAQDRGGRSLVCFGLSGPLDIPVCVDPVTGEVVQLSYTRTDVAMFVISSIGLFRATIDALSRRRPFYLENPTDQEIDKASEDVARIVRDIDPPAMEPHRFWSKMAGDVGMGDHFD
jgi:SUKH-4 immunity protein